MKKLLLFLIMIGNPIQYLFAQASFQFPSIDLSEKEQSEIKKIIKDFEVISIDTKKLNAFVTNGSSLINLQLNTSSHSWTLEFQKNEIKSLDHQTIENGDIGKTEEDINNFNTYKGYANRNVEQSIRLSISDNMFDGFISDQNGLVFIKPLAKFIPTQSNGSANYHIVFYANDLIDDPSIKTCGVDEMNVFTNAMNLSNSSTAASSSNCFTLEIATEADFEFYQNNGSSVAMANNNILSILNQVEDVYETTFNIKFIVRFQNVWTTSNDPYASTTSNVVIDELANWWQSNMTNISRDVVYFFSGKTGHDVRGRAKVFGAICDNIGNSYAFTASGSTFVNSEITTAHELGHLFNAIHPSDASASCSPSPTIMCVVGCSSPPCSDNRLFQFSSFSQNEINTWISNHNSCLSASNPSISKNNNFKEICSGESWLVTCTLPSGYPINYGFDWYATAGLLINNVSTSSSSTLHTTTNTITLSANTNSFGAGSVHVRLNNGSCYPSGYVYMQVQVGPYSSSQFSISGPSTACPNTTVSYLSTYIDPSITNYQWSWSGFASGSGQGTPYLSVTTGSSFTNGTITLRLGNRCGLTGSPVIKFVSKPYCSGGFSFSLSPNPTDETLTVAVVDEVSGIALTEEQLPTESDQTLVALVNNRSRVVSSGNLSKGKISFDVSGLPNGLYVVKISDGSRITSRQLIIKH